MNKRDHIINGVLVGIGAGIIIASIESGMDPSSPKLSTLKIVLAVTVPVVLGAMVPDIDTEFGRHRKTLHNLLVLAGFVAFPMVFGNLQFVWIGVLSHYVLDAFGSKRGIALFYPLSSDEWNPGSGVEGSNRHTSIVTVFISVFELVVGTAIVFTVLLP